MLSVRTPQNRTTRDDHEVLRVPDVGELLGDHFRAAVVDSGKQRLQELIQRVLQRLLAQRQLQQQLQWQLLQLQRRVVQPPNEHKLVAKLAFPGGDGGGAVHFDVLHDL